MLCLPRRVWYFVHQPQIDQSIGANLTDTITMVAMMLLVLMVMVLTAPSEGCVNSCCQACLADQCGVCYKLNNNPIMCPCIGEVGVTPASVGPGNLSGLSSLV